MAYLQELHPDLTPDRLREAIEAGFAGRRDTTCASAPGAPGGQQWYQTLEGIRTLLIECGWHPHEKDNGAFITAPDYSISIVVMTGDQHTGIKNTKPPGNQAKKGAVTKCFVEENQQLELFDTPPVWIFLYHYDKILDEVRFELSFPTGFSDGKINTWGCRLILGKISSDSANFTIKKDMSNAPVTVEVTPKTGSF